MKVLILVLTILASAMAFGQPPSRGDDQAAPLGGRLMKRLNLTDEQQSQVERMAADFRKAQIAIRAKINTAEVDLHTLFNQEAPDKAAIEAKQKEIHQFMADLAVNRTDFWFDVNKILKPDQQKTWKKFGLMAERGRAHGFMGMLKRHMRGEGGGWWGGTGR